MSRNLDLAAPRAMRKLAIAVVAACGGHAGGAADLAGGDAAAGRDATIDGAALLDGGTAGTVLLGAYTDQDSKHPDAFPDLETSLGHTLAIENQRETWTSMFATQDEAADLAAGVIPMISWTVELDGGCASPADIMAGVYDPQLVQQAHLLASWGQPVLVRFYKEFTDSAIDACFYGEAHPAKNPDVDGPKLVGTWQHVVDVFKHNGASNVQWVWGPSANLFSKDDGSPDTETWKAFYPGATYVDWIANDNYNKTDTPAAYADDPDINNWYGQVSLQGKPLMQSETGAAYDATLSPDPQTAWLTSAYQAIPATFPALKAFVYWDAQGDEDYRLQGAGLGMYTTMATDSYFAAVDVGGYFSSTGSP